MTKQIKDLTIQDIIDICYKSKCRNCELARFCNALDSKNSFAFLPDYILEKKANIPDSILEGTWVRNQSGLLLTNGKLSYEICEDNANNWEIILTTEREDFKIKVAKCKKLERAIKVLDIIEISIKKIILSGKRIYLCDDIFDFYSIPYDDDDIYDL